MVVLTAVEGADSTKGNVADADIAVRICIYIGVSVRKSYVFCIV